MRLNLPGDLLMSAAFDQRMVLQNHNAVAARSSSSFTNNNPAMVHQRPVLDLLVAMVAVPILILCALQLEKNLNDMADNPESRWLVFALGVGMLVVSVIICGYVTHRMGVCIWAGPIDQVNVNNSNMPRINSQNDILRIVDSMPPSYDSVVKFDIPPPPYECVIIDFEQSRDGDEQATNSSKELSPEPTTATALHM